MSAASMLVLVLRAFGPLLLAIGAAVLLDALTARRGLLPSGFRRRPRRLAALCLMALFFWIGVFFPLSAIGTSAAGAPAAARARAAASAEPGAAPKEISRPELFLLHGLMLLTIGLWFLLGFAGPGAQPEPAPPPAPVPAPVPALGEPPPPWTAEEPPGVEPPAEVEPPPAAGLATAPPPAPRPSLGQQFASQFGFVVANPWREIGLGVVFGIGAWIAVIAALVAVALVVVAIAGEKALPQGPPAMVSLIVSLPFLLRLALSLSAGIFEETFFRGFLQPRIGILLSTALFAFAHVGYGQPFLLVGVTVLSLLYGRLVRWRQNIWPAMAAHALFDGVQLLVVVPSVLRLVPKAH